MSEAPERVWMDLKIVGLGDVTAHADLAEIDDVEYIRKDVSDALVAAAREEALREAYQNLRTFAPHHEHNTGLAYERGYHTAMNRILDLITKDADNG